MSSNDPQSDKPLFQTPNPSELKHAAARDPIQARDSAQESDTNDGNIDRSEAEVDRLGAAEMQDSQVIRANISGH